MSTGKHSSPKNHRTRSIWRLLIIGATIAALTALSPTASAASQKAFHLAKNCDAFPTCVVTASNYKKIPVGTEITYSDTSVFPNALVPTIHGKHGTTTRAVRPDGDRCRHRPRDLRLRGMGPDR